MNFSPGCLFFTVSATSTLMTVLVCPCAAGAGGGGSSQQPKNAPVARNEPSRIALEAQMDLPRNMELSRELEDVGGPSLRRPNASRISSAASLPGDVPPRFESSGIDVLRGATDQRPGRVTPESVGSTASATRRASN